MTKRAALAAFAALVASVAWAQQQGGTSPVPAESEILERILVKVNGDVITQTDLENRQVELLRQQGTVPATEAALAEELRKVTPGIIVSAVDELLLVQQGRELGYQLTDEQFRQLLNSIKEDNNLVSDEELVTVLEQREGMTLDDLRRVLERQMLVSQVQQIEILQKISITDVEARQYYDTHLEEFTKPETVTLREILVEVPEGSAEVSVVADERAREEVEVARQHILDGEDFSRVAVSVSDAPSKANGGLIGPIELAVLSESVQELLQTLEVGGVSEVINTPPGYQVLMLEARTKATPRPFEDVRDLIADNVFSDRRRALYGRYLHQLRIQAIIEWKDTALRQVYEKFEAERAAHLGSIN